MPPVDKEGPVTLSVLDRLIDSEPERNQEPPLTRSQSLRELRTALRRDLEWLFNTRCTIESPPRNFAGGRAFGLQLRHPGHLEPLHAVD